MRSMVQKKAFEVDAWLARSDSRAVIILIYGSDRGLVSERARAFAEKSKIPLDDPFSVVRIDASSGEGESGRLLDEARMVSMFSAKRLIWLRNAGSQKPLADAVAELAAAPPEDALILIEAGELKKGAPLRVAVESAPCAMALPCYGDEGKSVDALINEELRRSRLTITVDARSALRALLGGDRLATRAELEKLALYAATSKEITIADISASIGDVSASSNDEMADHVLAGEAQAFASLFARHVQAAAQLHPLLAAAARQLQTIYVLRARMEAERQSAATAIAGMKPPPFPPRRAALEKAVPRWTADAAHAALETLQSAVLESRKRPDLALAIVERTLLRLAATAHGRAVG